MTETAASPTPGEHAERLSSDDRLAQRATKGEGRAFAAIYRRYHQDLYRYCTAIVGNPEDAQDALQNTMVKVLGALPGERRQIKLKPWLYRIAHNESIELLRRRRPTEEIDVQIEVAGGGVAEEAELRDRLRGLVGDLLELPDRQRGALVMRELAGLSFDQIATAFDTSPAVVRQTVYEARIGLQQMEEGRDMACEETRRAISDGDRRTIRRRDIRAHLRACPKCRAFNAGVVERSRDLTALAPLPAVASAGLLQGIIGGAHGSSGAATLGALGGGAGKVAATSAVAKSVAVVAVVAVAGVSATNRAGLTHVGLPGGGGRAASGSAAAGGAHDSGSAGGAGGTAGTRHENAAAKAKGGNGASGATAGANGQGQHGNAGSNSNPNARTHGAKGQHGNGNAPNGQTGNGHGPGGSSGNPGAGHRSQGGTASGHSQSSSHSQGKATSTPHSGGSSSYPAPPASPPSHANDSQVAPSGGQGQANGHAPDNPNGRPF